jgi:AbrB family looped-hinge helix DNA binding protein
LEVAHLALMAYIQRVANKGGTVAAQRGKIAEGGRLVIPADLRRQLGLRAGDSVVMEVEDGELRVRSLKAAVARAQALVRRYVPAGEGLVDELIRERRAEAARE